MKSRTVEPKECTDSTRRPSSCEPSGTCPGAQQQQHEPQGSGQSAQCRRPTVLLAEDDDEMRTLIAERLRRDGYDVAECRDGVELLSRLDCILNRTSRSESSETHFDLIVSDIRMPGVLGMTVLEGGQDFADFPPTILITAFGDRETHETAKQRGAVAVLDKPFEMDDLLSKVREIVPPGSD